ncbi:MAG: hypothetical protein V1806_12925 [Pseudomonadota bacterium]
MELPPYMKVISGTVEPRRRLSPPRRSSRGSESGASDSSTTAEVVSLVGRQNQTAAGSQIPTPVEARAALDRLQRDLPNMGQAVGDIHANLDRRRILVLLAPLVEG